MYIVFYLSAHLSRIVTSHSGVRPSTISNIFSSETTEPNKFKFHMETPKGAGTKVCSNGPGHMTKMAATLIYGETSLKSSPEPEGRCPWDLVCSIGHVGPTKFVQKMILC